MTDISALLRVTPVSGLEPQLIAVIGGFLEETSDDWSAPVVCFLEPPAGQRVPFIDATQAMEILFRRDGADVESASAEARKEYDEIRLRLGVMERIRFHDLLVPDSPECISVPRLVEHLQRKRLVSEDVIGFLASTVDTLTQAPIFRGPDNRDAPWTLAGLPDQPPPKAMIQFLPGASREMDSPVTGTGDSFLKWRDEIRPIAARLEKMLGEPVYYFSDPDCDYDDDSSHRFLALHWWCTYHPESLYVKFLLEACGAKDVEEFKATLIAPESYVHPFKMNDAFIGIEAETRRIRYFSTA